MTKGVGDSAGVRLSMRALTTASTTVLQLGHFSLQATGLTVKGAVRDRETLYPSTR